MNKIITLPPSIVSKISAGEVIDRPASCIKELVENSLDADSRKIHCQLKGNGVEFMSVIDDGCGIRFEDLELAIQPHSTSKLKKEEELYEVKTLGFRGEALPSICRVANVEISSKTKEEEVGGYLKVKGEKILEKKKIGRITGTTVTVRDLFYNIPVRRRFLKSDAIELRQIMKVIQKLALSYPQVEFKVVHNGKEYLTLPTQSLGERVCEFFGEEFFRSLRYIEIKEDEIEIYGYISQPYNILPHTVELSIINYRPSEEKVIKKSILHAYDVQLKEKRPSYILFVNLPHELVDVNIHPRKEEVRFREEGRIYNLVKKGIQKSLGIKSYFVRKKREWELDFEVEEVKVWQVYNNFILVETEEGLLLLDQHAVHERIMYETLKREQNFKQKLIFPLVVTLTPLEEKILSHFMDVFRELGFTLEEFGPNTWRITSIPQFLKEFSEEDFKTMLKELAEDKEVKKDRFDAVFKSLACRIAIKGGRKLTEGEIKNLLEGLKKVENPFFCPHGRVALIRLSRQELDAKFGK